MRLRNYIYIVLISAFVLNLNCGRWKKEPIPQKTTATSDGMSFGQLLAQLKVEDSPPCKSKKYSRDNWKHWIDADGDCLDTRQEVLSERSTSPAVLAASGCKVSSGKWHDPYADEDFTSPGELDIDHFVPLKNAHDSGGCEWSSDKKKRYANFLENTFHLMPVKASENRSKGDRSPDAWKPTSKSYYCSYAQHWVAIKKDWELSITSKEKTALEDMLALCK